MCMVFEIIQLIFLSKNPHEARKMYCIMNANNKNLRFHKKHVFIAEIMALK